MDELAVAINQLLIPHKQANVQVASGSTCSCGYWTGDEKAGVDRPVGVADPLNWHRANLIAKFLQQSEVEK